MGETNGTNGAAEASAAAETKKPFSRLPTTVKPVHYVVKVKPDLKKFTFTGSVEIQLDVNQATGTTTRNRNNGLKQKDRNLHCHFSLSFYGNFILIRNRG